MDLEEAVDVGIRFLEEKAGYQMHQLESVGLKNKIWVLRFDASYILGRNKIELRIDDTSGKVIEVDIGDGSVKTEQDKPKSDRADSMEITSFDRDNEYLVVETEGGKVKLSFEDVARMVALISSPHSMMAIRRVQK